ncbi:hypothetical protein LSAT2_029361 [Lamellibrachia satsuma]|nr:hypothetical protein LSAT2_029361 [Lamellibrachia satsuma]
MESGKEDPVQLCFLKCTLLILLTFSVPWCSPCPTRHLSTELYSTSLAVLQRCAVEFSHSTSLILRVGAYLGHPSRRRTSAKPSRIERHSPSVHSPRRTATDEIITLFSVGDSQIGNQVEDDLSGVSYIPNAKR